MRALVTGGTSGLGLAIARRLLADGHEVHVAGRRSAEAFASAAPDVAQKAPLHALDVRDLQQCAPLIDGFGPLDLLVSCAGVMAFEKSTDSTAASIERHLQTNLAGPIALASAAARVMAAQGGGHIVNIASVAGLKPTPKLAVYGAAKAGLVHYTKALAAELAPQKVRANVVCPGAVRTGLLPRAFFAVIERGVPLGTLQRPEDVAGLVAWLTGPEATHVTGAVFSLDGGMAL